MSETVQADATTSANNSTAISVPTTPRSAPMTTVYLPTNMQEAWMAAKELAAVPFVPEVYRGKPGACMVAIDMSLRYRSAQMPVSPLMIMQELYIVHGRPSFSALFIKAMLPLHTSYGKPRFEMRGRKGGDDRSCVCWAIDSTTGERDEGEEITVNMAKKDGWWSRKGSKWPHMTDTMLKNRAVTFFAREHAPELLLGVMSVDEAYDSGPATFVDADIAEPSGPSAEECRAAYDRDAAVFHAGLKKALEDDDPGEFDKLLGMAHGLWREHGCHGPFADATVAHIIANRK